MPDTNGNTIYAIDFDGTLSVNAQWPEIGQANESLFRFLKEEQELHKSRLILWTCRSGKDLNNAVTFCKNNGIIFDAVNESLPELIEAYGGDTRKIHADVYIDDKAVNPLPSKQAQGLLFGKFYSDIKKGI